MFINLIMINLIIIVIFIITMAISDRVRQEWDGGRGGRTGMEGDGGRAIPSTQPT